MSEYSQYINKETKQACSIVSLLNILLYRYGIRVEYSFIIKLAIYFDKLGVFSILRGATFNIIDNAFIFYINSKLGLKFKLITNTIPNLKKEDHRTYQIGIKKYSSRYWNKAKVGGEIKKQDVDDYLSGHPGIGHATNWDGSAGGYFVDTDGKPNTKMSYEVFKYAYEKGVLFKNIRTIQPNNKETEEIVKLTVQMFIAEKKGKLEQYLQINKNKIHINKAKELYFYGR